MTRVFLVLTAAFTALVLFMGEVNPAGAQAADFVESFDKPHVQSYGSRRPALGGCSIGAVSRSEHRPGGPGSRAAVDPPQNVTFAEPSCRLQRIHREWAHDLRPRETLCKLPGRPWVREERSCDAL